METLYGAAAFTVYRFVAMGVLQMLFPYRAVSLGKVSAFFTQSVWIKAVWVLAAFSYLLFLWRGMEWNWETAKRVRKIIFIVIGAAAAGTAGFLVMNAAGYVVKLTGHDAVQRGYLFFDDHWGNGRGIIWMVSAEMYERFTVLQKIWGIGPDCYASYAYRIPEFADRLNRYFGQREVRCAHNEMLHMLLCYGAFGAGAYGSIFVTGVRRYVRESGKTPQVFAILLCLISYMAHNIFCYQQVVCTPYIFALLGMAESMLRYRSIR